MKSKKELRYERNLVQRASESMAVPGTISSTSRDVPIHAKVLIAAFNTQLGSAISSAIARNESAPGSPNADTVTHFPHRASAAFRAIALRCFAVNDNKRAFPLA
jgi:hypothetical protein